MSIEKPAARNPWAWVPSPYLAEGTPYVMAMTVSVTPEAHAALLVAHRTPQTMGFSADAG